jgi:hypothetical protein
MELILWVLALVLIVAGVVAILRAQVVWGLVLVMLGLLVGPGGTSVLT